MKFKLKILIGKCLYTIILILSVFRVEIIHAQSAGGGVTDVDGNQYPSIIIGNQEWMSTNLRVGKYKNGDPIPQVTSNSTWASLVTPARCFYNNDSASFAQVFGCLYNFYTIEDPRGLCPQFWHVPSDSEWTTLTNFLGGLSVAGGKLKSTSTLWSIPNVGATNSSGFNGMPNGLRDFPGNFSSVFAMANWWSSTQRNMGSYFDGWYRSIWYNSSQIERMSYSKKDGFGIRCVKDFVCLDTITSNPLNINGSKSNNISITFTHSGIGWNFQWQSTAVGLGWQNIPNLGQYSNVNTNTLTINNLNVSNHNQLFRVVSSKAGCKSDTTAISKLTISNIATDSSRLVRLIGDSTRLTIDSLTRMARINKLAQDSGFFVNRIIQLSNDSVVLIGQINNLKIDSIFKQNRIALLINDSTFLSGRIFKLSSDSNTFVNRINNLIMDSINKTTTINILNADITTKSNIISFLQTDTTNKGLIIRKLESDLANKYDTVYVSSLITSDTLRITITTGFSPSSSVLNGISVYPNPATSILYFDLKNPGYYTATITGVVGQTIITPTSGTIDISGLANGVYILSIYDKDNKLVSKNKVMIMR
jgi:uncharacterized protein (TIGR02145 family)